MPKCEDRATTNEREKLCTQVQLILLDIMRFVIPVASNIYVTHFCILEWSVNSDQLNQ